MHTGTQYPITTHCAQAVTNHADYPLLKLGSPSAEAGPSSRSGPFTLQAGPSTTSRRPPDGHPSSSTQCNSDSLQAAERANEKRKETTLSDPTNYTTHPQNAVRAPHHHDAQSGNIRAGSTAYTTADDGDLQRVNVQLQAQVEQLRRQFDDFKRQADGERDLLEKEVADLRSRGHEAHKLQGHHLPPGTDHSLTVYCTQAITNDRGLSSRKSGSVDPPSSQAEPSGSNSNADASTHLAGPSTFFNVPPEGRRPSSAPSDSDLIEDEGGTSQ
ncbi:hypothetical protein PAXINDRAFT_20384 [Paxillus involutus ATCC 200175]|uniref:Uncharacterized protein n=1 Tax=Paxillus involutus ATCC 200175 TaxID=664439 RepID=A0A0C9SMM4_PAXIN|nr:hypothetical protein PAXINDRAFT_20384 [Paxillus involutus ATCC 200175]